MRATIIITAFFALVLLLAACSKTKVPSDATIRQMIIGKWRGDDVEVTFRPDLSWHDNNAQGMIDGEWRVDSGFLIMTITKWDTQTNLNLVRHYKVISIDSQEFVHGMDERDGNKACDNYHIRWIR